MQIADLDWKIATSVLLGIGIVGATIFWFRRKKAAKPAPPIVHTADGNPLVMRISTGNKKRRCAGIRHVGVYSGVGNAFTKLMAWGRKVGIDNSKSKCIKMLCSSCLCLSSSLLHVTGCPMVMLLMTKVCICFDSVQH